MEYRITDANAAHVAALEELEKQCFSVPWTREQLLSQLPDGRHEFLVALAEGAPVGYVGMMCVLDEGYISNVAVSPACRRQGIAGGPGSPFSENGGLLVLGLRGWPQHGRGVTPRTDTGRPTGRAVYPSAPSRG